MKTHLALGVVLNILGTGWSKFNIDDANLYDIKFNPLVDDKTQDEQLLNVPDLIQTVTMTTAHNEKYVCELPSEESADKNLDAEYDGPSVLKILEKVFIQSQCAYRLEHYWTYELCHGKYLRQYHEERDGKAIKTTEYFLGGLVIHHSNSATDLPFDLTGSGFLKAVSGFKSCPVKVIGLQ